MKDRTIQRESFILYKSFYAPISHLTDEQLGRLFRSIYLWQINGEADPDPDPDIRMAFGFFFNQFRIDNEKYSAKCEILRNNASKGGVAKASKRKQKEANRALNEKDNGNENVKDNVKTSLALPFSDQKFIDTWNELRKQPKWRNKTVAALQKSLDKLSRYDMRFALELINTAIEHGYQGVVYDDTPDKYEQWKRSHPLEEAKRDVYSAYDYD